MSNFKGEYRYTADEKGRINIPAKFRKLLAPEAQETFVVTQGLDKCLAVYPLDEWEKYERKLRALSTNKKVNRFYVRTIMSKACEVQYDQQGRIMVPAGLLDYAGITSDVVIIGVLEKIEIWEPKQYTIYFKKAGLTFEDVAENLFESPETSHPKEN